MPDLNCPKCGASRHVPRPFLGQHVGCASCGAWFRATAPPPTSYTHPRHPAGLWAGLFLLVVAASAVGWIAWCMAHGGVAARDTLAARVAIGVALTAGPAGALLMDRRHRATRRRWL
jgi:hypothetical protein